MPSDRVNVADRLTAAAANAAPRQQAVIARTKRSERTISFAQLEADATALAHGLIDLGVRPGTRLALLVPPSPEFVALVFALLRSGATTILVDPGMGKKHLVDCLAAAEPDGFIASSKAQAVRSVMRRRFPHAKLNVTVGRRWFWGGLTYNQLVGQGRASAAELPANHADDPAAIIFTSGSTGPPKGVLYTHRMFDAQAGEIQRAYDIKPGGADLACFALFGLFNAVWGVTTVFPHMDFSRPAAADPLELLAAANLHRVTQAFASPAIWDKLSRNCEVSGTRIPSLRKVFSCGAPVRADVIERTLKHVVANGAEMHTPYGATEALPVATIEAKEILGETAAKTAQGAGICVGRKFDSVEWRVIKITGEPIADIDVAEELPRGEIGELIVRGPQVSPTYMTFPAPSPSRGGLGRGEEVGASHNHPSLTLPLKGREPEGFEKANALAKIPDNIPLPNSSPLPPRASPWHRMGDVGYLDALGRFWYCGRKSHRVEAANGTLYTECVEAVFNQHPEVARSALVRVDAPEHATPVVIIEAATEPLASCESGTLSANCRLAWGQLTQELLSLAVHHDRAASVRQYLLYPVLPVDVRHNAKINREKLAAWAHQMLNAPRTAAQITIESAPLPSRGREPEIV
jgi:acyl-CoA synthetase (AMP-forming)/AMP-acid ligase II